MIVKRIIFIVGMSLVCGVSNGMIQNGAGAYEANTVAQQQSLIVYEQIKNFASEALNDYSKFLEYTQEVYAGRSYDLDGGDKVFSSNDIEFRRALAKEFFEQVKVQYALADSEQKKQLANVSWIIYFSLRCGDTSFADTTYKVTCESLSKKSGGGAHDHLFYMHDVLKQISEKSFIFLSFKAFLRDVYNIVLKK